MNIALIHADCLGCLAERERLSPIDTVVLVLSILQGRHTVEEVTRDLCFAHRRRVQDVAAKTDAELP